MYKSTSYVMPVPQYPKSPSDLASRNTTHIHLEGSQLEQSSTRFMKKKTTIVLRHQPHHPPRLHNQHLHHISSFLLE